MEDRTAYIFNCGIKVCSILCHINWTLISYVSGLTFLNMVAITHLMAKQQPQHRHENSVVKLTNQRVYSTLYVGLARAVSPTNTTFWLTFLLTRLQEALYQV